MHHHCPPSQRTRGWGNHGSFSCRAKGWASPPGSGSVGLLLSPMRHFTLPACCGSYLPLPTLAKNARMGQPWFFLMQSKRVGQPPRSSRGGKGGQGRPPHAKLGLLHCFFLNHHFQVRGDVLVQL